MKKLLLLMAFVSCLAGCEQRPQPLEIDNSLTAEEIAAAKFTPEVMWKMGRIGAAVLSPDGAQLLYTVTYYNMDENRGVTAIYLRDMVSGAVRQLTDHASNNLEPQWSVAGDRIYFLSDRSGSSQIWSMEPSGEGLVQVSSFDKDIEAYGVSPRGDKLFYVQRVQVCDRKSADVHKDLPKSKARIYDDLMARHWNYWDEGSYLHIFVGDVNAEGKALQGVDIIGAESAWDAPLAPYFDAGEISWSADGAKLAYTCKPLTGYEYAVSTDSDIFIYDVSTGKSLNICKALPDGVVLNTDRRRVAQMPGYDKYPAFSPNGELVAFRSQRRAGNESDKERLFVWNSTTGEMRDLTSEFDYNATNLIWDGNEALYFIAPIEATHQLCRVTLDGEVKVLTSGDHDIVSATIEGGRAVVAMQKITHATELFEVNIADGRLAQISNVNQEIYDNIPFGKVEKRWVRPTDGKKMLVWVILPPDFDPAKKYPTLLYCQGGPQSVVSQFWSYRWNFQLMASQGYVVVAPNRRGLPSFGQEWLDQISGDYSGQNIRDYLSAIDDVAREPWCDKERLGCVGASYGGYSVFFLAGCHQQRFKAFIAHCGIFNFESMYGETEELFFINNDYGGPYWDKSNRTAQRSYANSPHKFVDKWDTPILIITGEYDFRIPYTQSLQAFTAAKARGLDARLVEFENEAHQVFKPQNSLVWNREFFGWLDKYLK